MTGRVGGGKGGHNAGQPSWEGDGRNRCELASVNRSPRSLCCQLSRWAGEVGHIWLSSAEITGDSTQEKRHQRRQNADTEPQAFKFDHGELAFLNLGDNDLIAGTMIIV